MTDVARDGYGRPLIVPLGGGKPIGYTRCTTYINCLSDRFALEQWKTRQTALGLATRPDLISLLHAKREDKREINNIVERAIEASGGTVARDIGTALHGMTELVDAGYALDTIPPDHRADIDAYLEATQDLKHTHIETLTVLDSHQIAGTPDRISTLPTGQRVIFDLKTGSDIKYSIPEIAMQLAVYAHSQIYNVDTHERTQHNADKTIGIIAHLPAGSAKCELIEVDLVAGWEAVQLAKEVRQWRNRKGLSKPYVPRTITPEPVTAINHNHIIELINACDYIEALEAVYELHIAEWNNELTACAAERKRQLSA
jgi:hypothetical protein